MKQTNENFGQKYNEENELVLDVELISKLIADVWHEIDYKEYPEKYQEQQGSKLKVSSSLRNRRQNLKMINYLRGILLIEQAFSNTIIFKMG